MSLAPGVIFSEATNNFGTSISIRSETNLITLAESRPCLMNEKRLKDFQASNIDTHESDDPNLVMLSRMSNTLSSRSISKERNNLCIETANLCFIIGAIVELLRNKFKDTGNNVITCFKSSFFRMSIASLIKFAAADKIKDSRSIDDSFEFKNFQMLKISVKLLFVI